MAPLLNHSPAIKHKDAIAALDSTQAMCNGDGGAASLLARHSLDSGLHLRLGGGVKSRGCLVEEQDVWFTNKGASDGEALTLTAAEGDAAVTYLGGVAVG